MGQAVLLLVYAQGVGFVCVCVCILEDYILFLSKQNLNSENSLKHPLLNTLRRKPGQKLRALDIRFLFKILPNTFVIDRICLHFIVKYTHSAIFYLIMYTGF